MRYTELTKKELQREYTKLTRRYTDFVREPLELDMTAEDIFGKSESRRAARHFGTVLGKELSDTGAAQPAPVEDAVAALATMPGCAPRTVELCRQAGVRFDAIDHSTVLARIIPADARSEELTHAASVFAISARLAAWKACRACCVPNPVTPKKQGKPTAPVSYAQRCRRGWLFVYFCLFFADSNSWWRNSRAAVFSGRRGS